MSSVNGQKFKSLAIGRLQAQTLVIHIYRRDSPVDRYVDLTKRNPSEDEPRNRIAEKYADILK